MTKSNEPINIHSCNQGVIDHLESQIKDRDAKIEQLKRMVIQAEGVAEQSINLMRGLEEKIYEQRQTIKRHENDLDKARKAHECSCMLNIHPQEKSKEKL